MFTGIVQGLAEVVALERKPQFMQLRLRLPSGSTEQLQIGASIAINGTCLTVTEFTENEVQFDLIEETLRVTNLEQLQLHDKVNFERAARFGDEIGGHQLSGHVSHTATITEIIKTEQNCVIWFQAPRNLLPYLLPKGFVALNGCSLTIAEIKDDQFNVFLIPETLKMTTFGSSKTGDKINLEVDPQTQAIVDTVNNYLKNRSI